MTYEELVQKVREAYSGVDVSNINEHVAIEVNIRGEAEGAFYIEIRRERVLVEPYEYYDRDLIIVTTADVIMQMVEGKIQPRVAYTKELLKLYGDVELVELLPFGCK